MVPQRAPRLLAAAIVLLATFSLGGSCSGPPAIQILSPAHGTFSPSPSTTISGDIKNIGVTDAVVTVNGQVVPVQPNKTWSVTVPLNQAVVVNPFLAELTQVSTGRRYRSRIVVLAGDSIPDGMFSPQSVALRLNDSGLDKIEPLIETLTGSGLDLAALLPPGTVLINNQCFVDGGFVGCLGRGTVSISTPAPSFSSFALNVDSQTNVVAGFIDVNNIVVNVYISGSGLVPSCGLRLTANRADIDGNYALQPDAIEPSNIDVNQVGNLSVGFSNFNQQYTSGICDAPIIGDIIQLFIGDVENDVKNGLQSFLNDPDGSGPLDGPIADAIETTLAGISIAGPLGEGLGVNLETPLFGVFEDTAGITLGSDTRVFTSIGTGPGQCEPPPGAPDLAASYHVVEPFPTFGTATPVNGLPYDLGLCINSSAFNQLLKSEVECGLLRTELTEIDLGGGPIPITSSLLGLFIPQFAPISPPIPLKIRITPTLAPIVTGATGPAGELAEMRIGQLLIEIVGGTPEVAFLGGAADVRFGFDISLDPQTGSLAFALSEPNPAAGDVTLSITNNSIGTNEATVESFLPFVVAPLLPSLSASLGSLPLPQFFGLGLGPVEVSRNGQFMSVFADLVPTP